MRPFFPGGVSVSMYFHIYWCLFVFMKQEVNLFSFVAVKNYGRKMLSSSFNYVVPAVGQNPRVDEGPLHVTNISMLEIV